MVWVAGRVGFVGVYVKPLAGVGASLAVWRTVARAGLWQMESRCCANHGDKGKSGAAAVGCRHVLRWWPAMRARRIRIVGRYGLGSLRNLTSLRL